MKKLLLLGGSYQQIPAIETAKSLGYFTVLCDYLSDNPGQHHANSFHLVSTTDREAVLRVATEEKIDGILAYASDPAAPTAAYVAERLGLPTNPLESVEILCNKDKLRTFLKENGFNVPVSEVFDDPKLAAELQIDRPKIVKPVDSSGSKGVTVVCDNAELQDAINKAFSFSRCKKIIIEDYIEKNHPYILGGDIFVSDGEIKIWGLMNCHRDTRVNDLVPVGKSYPPDIQPKYLRIAKDTLKKLVSALNIKSGAMNVEMVVTEDASAYILDIGPRAGGNMIPELLSEIFSVDIVKLCVLSAMGEALPEIDGEPKKYYATHNLHSSRTGILESIDFSENLEKHITKKCIYVNSGDEISYFDYSSKALGIIFMKFEDEEEMYDILDNINKHININVKEAEIGGYFGTEMLSGRKMDLYYDGPYWPNTARNALVLLLNSYEAEKVYIPYYLCESVSSVLTREGFDFEYYHVDSGFKPVFDKRLGKHEFLYVVNYFGQLDESYIKELKDTYERVILDNVQAFFTSPIEGIDTIYSCRKFFGVPDGAYVSTDRELEEVPLKNETFDNVPYLSGRLRDGASAHYAEFKAHDMAFREEEPMTASILAINMLSRIDYQLVRSKREENYKLLEKALGSVNKPKIKMAVGPYCYPFYCENGDKTRKELAEKKIYVPTLWENVVNLIPGSVEADYAINILPLPCDQRYDERDMKKIIDALLG